MEVIEWKIKTFDALTTLEWYKIAKLRTDVFIVEQACVYDEFDQRDQRSLHLFLEDDGAILSYSRLLPPGVMYKEASISRVIVRDDCRGEGYGKQLLQEAIDYLSQVMKEPLIKIQAEQYLTSFYQGFGFRVISEPYLDCGIAHVDMLREGETSDI